MELVRFSQSIWDEIIAFNKKAFPLRKGVENSFQDRFFKNPYSQDFSKSTFIRSQVDEILGQFLVMPTRFHYQNQSYNGFWGIDFFIDEKLRGQKKGKILAKSAIEAENYCAIGPSKVSEALHLKFGNKEVAKALRYIRPIGFSSFWNFLFHNKVFTRENVSYPNQIIFKSQKVSRLFSSENLNSKEFWNPDFLEWDRSNAFLEWRFFSYQNKYAFYLADDQSFYFVVRKIRWRNINCLLLVDYRYQNENDFETIFQLALKLASKTQSIGLISLSSMDNEKLVLKKYFNKTFGEPIPVMTTNIEVENAKKVMVTPADSDFDTFYGDNIW